MAVTKLRRKPEKQQADNGITAAQYKAGAPLDDLRAVAELTCGAAALAECGLPDETVLVVRWVHYTDDHPAEVAYEVVKDGDWLYYSHTYDSLGDDTTRGIEQWYEPA